MGGKPDEALTIEELSTHLKIPTSTLDKLVCQNKVSYRLIERRWGFRRAAIDHRSEETHEDRENGANEQ
jgi:hypothetical protein